MPSSRTDRTIRLLICAAISGVALLGQVRADDDVRRMPGAKMMSAPGQFLQWRDARHLVISSATGSYSLLDVASLTTAPLQTDAPDPGDVRITGPTTTELWKDTFFGVITETHNATGTKTTWFHYLYPDQPYLNIKHDLIDVSDGAIELYTAAESDEAMSDKVTTIAPTRSSRYAFFNKADSPLKPLPVQLQLSELPLPPRSNYRWSTLTSRKDTADGRYFLFFANERLLALPARGFQGWSPFNAWWIDVKVKTSEHVVLPDGPWVRDAQSKSPVRKLICYPADCDDFRHYDFKVAGHKIFLRITADREVLTERSLGIYTFEPASNAWVKVADSDATLGQISPDGCAAAINQGREVSVFNLCLPLTSEVRK
jgi:hypothetical protein